MSRGERVRAEVEARYPALRQFFGCHLHADCLIDYATPHQAVDAAIAVAPAAHRQRLRRELADLLGSTDEDTRLRRVLNDGLGVNLSFRKPREARAFAEAVERKLLESPKAAYGIEEDRKP
jgi:CdiI immunity protein